eukprot:CAMPEP_0114981990 /NCGR_PEP_ID=MMETSP0216-20121206/5848_1 /TAXON_ID=223996 /ORGANISM="Protocruzia adherens, Strain Boccale" /LENGTH=477 /DNA_ID=CAMNT_0002343717 /DNA_START=424 /DNA_END=1857 /DNA_ORIENTATION=+
MKRHIKSRAPLSEGLGGAGSRAGAIPTKVVRETSPHKSSYSLNTSSSMKKQDIFDDDTPKPNIQPKMFRPSGQKVQRTASPQPSTHNQSSYTHSPQQNKITANRHQSPSYGRSSPYGKGNVCGGIKDMYIGNSPGNGAKMAWVDSVNDVEGDHKQTTVDVVVEKSADSVFSSTTPEDKLHHHRHHDLQDLHDRQDQMVNRPNNQHFTTTSQGTTATTTGEKDQNSTAELLPLLKGLSESLVTMTDRFNKFQTQVEGWMEKVNAQIILVSGKVKFLESKLPAAGLGVDPTSATTTSMGGGYVKSSPAKGAGGYTGASPHKQTTESHAAALGYTNVSPGSYKYFGSNTAGTAAGTSGMGNSGRQSPFKMDSVSGYSKPTTSSAVGTSSGFNAATAFTNQGQYQPGTFVRYSPGGTSLVAENNIGNYSNPYDRDNTRVSEFQGESNPDNISTEEFINRVTNRFKETRSLLNTVTGNTPQK